jgi:hypothetical protein
MKSYIEIQTVIDDLKSLASSIRYSDGDTDYYALTMIDDLIDKYEEWKEKLC